MTLKPRSHAVFVLTVLAACGGSVASTTGDPPGLLPDGGIPPTGKVDGGGDGGKKKDSGMSSDGGPIRKDAGEFVEPECPDRPPPITQYECDVVAQTGCASDMGCYPFIEYPTGYCEAETYGSYCAPAGTGTQGTICGQDAWCAPGYACVVSGAGTVCAKNCQFNQGSGCEEGKICEPTDMPEIGVCL